MSARDDATNVGASKLYPGEFHGVTPYLRIPGAGDPQTGPAIERELEASRPEAIEANAESSDTAPPRFRTFADAGVLTTNRGLVVRIGDTTLHGTIVRSR